DVVLSVRAHEKHHVRPLQRAHVTEPDTRTEASDLETDLLQNGREERVLLEAIAAPMPVDDLARDRVDADVDQLAEMDIEVLERDRRHMCQVDAFQRAEIGSQGTRIADARTIRVEIYSRARTHATILTCSGGHDV